MSGSMVSISFKLALALLIGMVLFLSEVGISLEIVYLLLGIILFYLIAHYSDRSSLGSA